MTKKEKFEKLHEIVESAIIEDNERKDYLEFIDNEIIALERKAAKAAERAAIKRAKGDDLRELVLSKVTNELQTAIEITEAINDPEISKAKVAARLTQLVNVGSITKETVKVDNHKLAAYKLA